MFLLFITNKMAVATRNPGAPFESFVNPKEGLTISADTSKNAYAIYCPRPECASLILRPGAAELVSRSKPDLHALINPEANRDEVAEGSYWMVSDMMTFENMGFSKLVGTVKYLSCADCDIPLGFHDTAKHPEFLVDWERVRYKV